jgi:hypothetical protein
MPKNVKREASPNPSKGGDQENNLSVDNKGIEPFLAAGLLYLLLVPGLKFNV